VLVFVGAKMTLADVYEIPVFLSLAVIVATLGAAVAASLLRSAPVEIKSPESPRAAPVADGSRPADELVQTGVTQGTERKV
jgi:hypothetical protein